MKPTLLKRLEEIRRRYLAIHQVWKALNNKSASAVIAKKYCGIQGKGLPKHQNGIIINNEDGGPGSGNHGHAGIPGTRGGSAPGGTTTQRFAMSNDLASGSAVDRVLRKQQNGTTIKVSFKGKQLFSGTDSRGILRYNSEESMWTDIDTGQTYTSTEIAVVIYNQATLHGNSNAVITFNENRERPGERSKSSGFEGVVQGKDISDSFTVDRSSNLNGVEQAAEIQGYNKAPQVVSSEEEFIQAAAACGTVGFRSVHGEYGGDKNSEDVCNEYMYKDGIKYNYGGGQLYGEGIYLATSKSLMARDVEYASEDSWGYGPRQMAITFTSDIKLADEPSLRQRWDNLADSTKRKYMVSGASEMDGMTAYAAALGYDGVKSDSGWCDYTVVFNRSKMVVYEETSTGRHTQNFSTEALETAYLSGL